MQLGRLEEMDQSNINHINKISKIQQTDEKYNIVADDKYKNVEKVDDTPLNEVMLDNVKFGYNKKVKEFFVRFNTEEFALQFPTKEIMKLKEYLHDDLNGKK